MVLQYQDLPDFLFCDWGYYKKFICNQIGEANFVLGERGRWEVYSIFNIEWNSNALKASCPVKFSKVNGILFYANWCFSALRFIWSVSCFTTIFQTCIEQTLKRVRAWYHILVYSREVPYRRASILWAGIGLYSEASFDDISWNLFLPLNVTDANSAFEKRSAYRYW